LERERHRERKNRQRECNLKIRNTISLATLKRGRKISEKTNQSADKQVTDEDKKDLPKFDSWTDRDKANINVSQASNILGTSTLHAPAKEVHFEFTQTFPLSRSPTTRNEFARSFKRITSSLCTTCGDYPVDRLPKVWTRSTAIVTNTDDHDRPEQHWVALYIDERGTGTYFDSYSLPPLDPRFLLRFRRNSTTLKYDNAAMNTFSNLRTILLCISILFV